MKIARLAGVMIIAIIAMSLIAASVATAEPEFKPASGTLTGTSGEGVLEANNGVDKVVCTSDVSSGTIASATTVTGVKVSFLGCKSSGEGGNNCTAKSTNTTTPGLINTVTLNGVLGLVLPKPSSGGVGLLLSPATGSEFVTLSGNTCTETTKVTGTVTGEASPLNSKQTTGKLTFVGAKGSQSIKAFDGDGVGAGTAKLTAFGTSASESTAEALTFSTALEVT